MRRNFLKGIVAIMISSLFTGCIVRSALYPAPNIAVPDNPPPGMKEVVLQLATADSVVCWLYHNESLSDTAPVLLFLHGNGENLQTLRLSRSFDLLAGLNVHFIALDYPGYGRSTGAPSENSIARACDSALLWIAGHYPKSSIIVCGWSLGAAAAISAAGRNPTLAKGLVAMSAWTSLYDVARRFYPGFLIKLFVRDKYNSLNAIANVKCPVVLIHGRQDQLIPAGQGEALSHAAPMLRRWVALEVTGHNDLLDNPLVWKEIGGFILSFSSPQTSTADTAQTGNF
jgi:pimeloyl-ACP methyl ester carboxylesterase